jgi:hypothetical protein
MPKRATYSQPIKDMGFLLPNQRITGPSSPDHVGEIVVDDVPYRVSLWDEAKGRKTVSLQRMADYS